MMVGSESSDTLNPLDAEHVALVRLAAAVTSSAEPGVRRAIGEALRLVRRDWVEEVLLQSYLFAGFPRTLNAMREWRRISGPQAPDYDDGEDFARADQWAERGEATCEVVYGPFYRVLRQNIRALHPALDSWMIVEGYGKVLSRPGLDLMRRELCIVAACAAAGQERQLHSHLHGALHAGATPAQVGGVLDCLADLIDPAVSRRYELLLAKVVGRHVH